MRDMHFLKDKKISVASVEEALAIVRQKYPSAYKQGAVCSWSFFVDKEMVAESWIKHGKSTGWWLRIKQ